MPFEVCQEKLYYTPRVAPRQPESSRGTSLKRGLLAGSYPIALEHEFTFSSRAPSTQGASRRKSDSLSLLILISTPLALTIINSTMEPVVLPSGDNTTNPQAQTQTTTSQFLDYVLEESTFFRVHLFAFTFVPLVSSGIFYACNGQFRISYLDSLFLCYSAMTVTGLATVNLSTLTAWQQVITYLLMLVVCSNEV